MSSLIDLPDALLLGSIFQYLTATDLCRLGATCRHLNKGDSAVQKKLKERDSALIQSKQYPPESAIMSVFDYRERVFCFERCRTFAWEMTRQAQRHNSRCKEPGCTYPNLHAWLPKLANGARGGKHYFFFALFTSKDKLLWQGFLQDYDPESDFSCPMDGILRNSDEGLSESWIGFQREIVDGCDVQFHLDASNVSNLTKDHMTADLYVTLVSLCLSQNQPRVRPELHLHYVKQGFESQYPPSPSPNNDSPSIFLLKYQDVEHHWKLHDYAHPFLLWKSKTTLHSLSMLYFGSDDFDFDAYYDREVDWQMNRERAGGYDDDYDRFFDDDYGRYAAHFYDPFDDF